VGCILYADDIIILSVSGLQSMLNCCFDVSRDLQLGRYVGDTGYNGTYDVATAAIVASGRG